jgi:hypothetical protein
VARRRLEILENGQHAPVGICGRRQVELSENARHVLLDGAVGDHELLGDRAVRSPLRHQAENLGLARGETSERIAFAVAPEEMTDDLWIERRPTTRNTIDRVGELTQIGHPLLEQAGSGGQRNTQ